MESNKNPLTIEKINELKEINIVKSELIEKLYSLFNFCIDDYEISGHSNMLVASKKITELMQMLEGEKN